MMNGYRQVLASLMKYLPFQHEEGVQKVSFFVSCVMSWQPLAMGAKKYLLLNWHSESFISYGLQRIILHTKAFRILNHKLFELAVFAGPLALSNSRILGVVQDGDRDPDPTQLNDGYIICCPNVSLQHKDYMALRSRWMDLCGVHRNHILDHRQMRQNLHTCANEARATFHRSKDVKNLECFQSIRNDSSSANLVQRIITTLDDRSWGLKSQEVLGELNVFLVPSIVNEVLTYQSDIKKAISFFYWAGAQKGYKHTSSTYNHMIQKLATAKDFKVLLKVMEEMKADGSEMTNNTLRSVLLTCGANGKPVEALQIFYLAVHLQENPNTNAYNILIMVLTSGGYSHTAYRMFRRMSKVDVRPDAYTYHLLIHSFLKLKRVGMATHLLEAMNRRGLIPNVITLNAMIDSLGKNGNLIAARNLFQEMKIEGSSSPPDVCTYNTLLNILCKHGKGSEACELYKEMRATGYVADLPTYRSLIGGLCKIGKIQDAIQIFKDMTPRRTTNAIGEDNSMSDEYIYSQLIEALREVGDYGSALKLFKEMTGGGYVGNSGLYISLISSLGKAGRFSEANLVLNQMVKNGLKSDVVGYGALIDGYTKASMMEHAMEVFWEMKEKNISPNTIVYNTLIAGFGKITDWRAAQEVYDNMMKDGCIPDFVTYKCFIRILGQAGRVEESYKLLKEMEKRGIVFDTAHYNVLVLSFCAVPSLIGESVRLIERMRKRGLSPQHHVQSAVIQAYIKGEKWEEALIFLESMLKHKCLVETTTYTSLISLLTKKGEFVKACSVFKDMNELGCMLDEAVYNMQLRCLGRTGNIHDAVKLMEVNERKFSVTKVTYASLLADLWRAHDLDAACEFYKETTELGFNHDALGFDDFIKSLSHAGKTERASELFEDVVAKGINPSASSYSALIRGLALADQVTDACNLFEDMKEKGTRADAATFVVLINSLGRIGQVDAALELFDEMNERGLRPNSHSYKGLLENLVQWGVYK